MPVNSFDDYPLTWRPRRDAVRKTPIYLSLAAALECDILSGSLPPGTRLPPQRELADFLDLDFTTVTRAYGVCRGKNLVYGVTGRGTFVASMPGEEEAADCDFIDLGAVDAFPEIGSAAVVSAARRVLARDSAAGLFSYAERDGKRRHRAAGMRWLSMCGVDAPCERIAVFPGVQSALSTAMLSVFSVGDAIATDAFTYANLIEFARLAHVKLVPVAGDGEGMLPEALSETAAARNRLRGVFIMPNDANPTTRTLSEKRKDALAEAIAARGLLLMEDDATLDVAAGSGRTTLHSRIPDRTIYLSGSTRLVSSGLRTAYVAFPDTIRTRFLAGLHHTAIKASALDAEIMGELVVGGAAECILREKAARAMKANAIFDRTFPGVNPGDARRLFRTLPAPGTAGMGPELERRCLDLGVKVCHSDRFAAAPGLHDSFFRVSVSSAGTLRRLEDGLLRLREAVGRERAATASSAPGRRPGQNRGGRRCRCPN